MPKATLQGGPLNGTKVDVGTEQTTFIAEGKDGKKYEYRMPPFAAFQGKTHNLMLRFVREVREEKEAEAPEKKNQAAKKEDKAPEKKDQAAKKKDKAPEKKDKAAKKKDKAPEKEEKKAKETTKKKKGE